MPTHLQRVRDLHSDNEYREGREDFDIRPYDSGSRRDVYAARKAGIRADDEEDWVDC